MKTYLKNKLLFIFSCAIVLIFIALITTRYWVTLPQLHKLEALADAKDVTRIKNALNSKVSELALVNYDNAVWDEAFEFVNTGDINFIESNFVLDTFQSLDISGLYYFNQDADLVWGKSYDRDTWKAFKEPMFASRSEAVTHVFMKAHSSATLNGEPSTQKGVLFVDKHPIIFAATSVMNSNGEGQSNGVLLFYRYLLKHDEGNIRDFAELDVEFIWPSDTNYQQVLQQVEQSQLVLNKRNENGVIYSIAYDVELTTPYFMKLKQSERMFDDSLIDVGIWAGLLTAILILLILYRFVAFDIIVPILSWKKIMRNIVDSHNYSLRFDPQKYREFSIIADNFNKLMDFTEAQEQALRHLNEHLLELSNADGLTGVYNRRFFDNTLHELWLENKANTPVSLCLCDIDFFKPFNDHYGHQEGDRVIREVAQALMKNSKRQTDIVARYGGEEFAVILRNTDAKSAEAVAQTMRQAVFSLAIAHEKSTAASQVTLSIGVHTLVPSTANSPRELIHKADEALYRAKANGRNNVVVWQDNAKP